MTIQRDIPPTGLPKSPVVPENRFTDGLRSIPGNRPFLPKGLSAEDRVCCWERRWKRTEFEAKFSKNNGVFRERAQVSCAYVAKKILFHGDRGVRYASDELRQTLKRFGITQGMSGKGDRLDDGPCESFWGNWNRGGSLNTDLLRIPGRFSPCSARIH